VFVRSAIRVAASFLFEPGKGARLRFHSCICCANTSIAAAIMESLVPMFCGEPAIAEFDVVEFVDAGAGMRAEAVLSSLGRRRATAVFTLQEG